MPDRFEDNYENEEDGDEDEEEDEYVHDDDDPGFETDEEDQAPSRWGRIVKIVALALVAGMIIAKFVGCDIL